MNSRTVLVRVGTLLIAAITVLTAAFGSAKDRAEARKNYRLDGPAVGRAQKNDVQTATVELNSKGFEPSSLKLKPGVPAKVTFVRKTDETCAKEVVIKNYKIERKLPLNEPVTVELTPRKGEFTFACAMNMVRGTLIVE